MYVALVFLSLIVILNSILLVYLILRYRRDREDQLTSSDKLQSQIIESLNLPFTNLKLSVNDLFHKANEGTATLINNLVNKVDSKLDKIGEINEIKLEQMRKTVDEKLNDTLNQRLTEKFKLVSQQMVEVSQGIGQVKMLTKGVDDLKSVLSSVKSRGTWGEIQLESLLSDILSSHQYSKQFSLDNSLEKVDFVINIPSNESNNITYLPIDAKFPIEEYQRLTLAIGRNNIDDINASRKKLFTSLKTMATSIQKKYIIPPITTDFAILYLPLESLFAEISSNDELIEQLRNNNKVIVSGPSTMAALISALQLGFRSMTITKKAHQVWELLNVVKHEFSKLDDLLIKAAKNIQAAGNQLESATKRTSIIDKKLSKVDSLELKD